MTASVVSVASDVAGAALAGTLDNAPLTRTHLKVWFLSAMGVALDGFDFFIIGVALPLIDFAFHPQPWETGAIGAAAVLGVVVGALSFGPITDKVGRRTMYLVDLLFFVVFALLSALAWSPWSLIAFRFLLGVGIGADYPISATYVAEMMPSRLRGRMVSMTIGFQAVGMLSGALVGLLILKFDPSINAWRWMLGVGVVPALLVALTRLTVPESPRWLLAHGQPEKAAEETAEQLLGPQGVVRSDMTLTPQPGKSATLRRLLRPGLRRRTLLAVLPWFLMDVATYGIGIFTPTILAAIAVPNGPATGLAREFLAIEGAAFCDLFLALGFVLGILLVERVGRIPLQMIGFAAMAGSLLMLARVSAFSDSPAYVPLVFTGFILFNTLMNLGPNLTTYVLPAELFPTNLRATGHGLAAATGKLGATLGIFLLPILQAGWGLPLTLTLLAGVSLLGLVATWAFRVETAGRSLQEFE